MKGFPIIKKMTIMFVVVIVVFVGIIMGNLRHHALARDLHGYRTSYLQQRSRILSEMQDELRYLTFEIVGSFNNSEWLAGAGQEEVAAIHARLDSGALLLEKLSEEYSASVSHDSRINAILGFDVIQEALAGMETVMAHVRDIHAYYRIPEGGPPGSFQIVTVGKASPAIAVLEEIRELNARGIGAISEALYASQNRLFDFNIISLTVTGLMAFIIFKPAVGAVKKQIVRIEEKSQAIRSGDFSIDIRELDWGDSHNEIGRLSNAMGDVVDTFKGVVASIIQTAQDVGEGKLESRLDEGEFEGEFRAAAAGVNMLAEKIMEKAQAVAEEEYSGYVQFIMDTVPVSICFWDADRKIINCNSETVKILGISCKQEFMDRPFEFSPPVQPGGAPSDEMSKFHLEEAFSKGTAEFEWTHRDRAGGGQQAVDLVRQGKVYDIIFMDHMMPGMDGMEATRLIRGGGYKKPVVALTANALIGQAELFMSEGFDGFISKPIDTSHLNSILNKFVRDRHPKDVVAAARESASAKNPADMRDFEESVRKEFARSQKKTASEIRAALARGDTAACARLAHTLKGLARTVGEGELGDAAARLEGVFSKNGPLEAGEAGGLIDDLELRLALAVEKILDRPGAPALRLPDVAKILEDLEPLLQDSSIESLAVAEKLKSVPQAAILIRQIEDYDFEGALVSLPVLKNIAA